MVGEVVAIEQERISIMNARGNVTTLILPDDARQRGVEAISDVAMGQRIMAGRSASDETISNVKDLRVFQGVALTEAKATRPRVYRYMKTAAVVFVFLGIPITLASTPADTLIDSGCSACLTRSGTRPSTRNRRTPLRGESAGIWNTRVSNRISGSLRVDGLHAEYRAVRDPVDDHAGYAKRRGGDQSAHGYGASICTRVPGDA